MTGRKRQPKTTLAIDPALTCTGWAYFEGDELKVCGVVETRPKDQSFSNRLVAAGKVVKSISEVNQLRMTQGVLVVEWPQIYTLDKSKGDPNDLLAVAGVAAAAVAQLPHAQAILPKPKQWKGQVPKDVHNARVAKRLTETELGAVTASGVAKSKQHNMLDAIGLGFWVLGRMVPKKQGVTERAANDDREKPSRGRSSRRRRAR